MKTQKLNKGRIVFGCLLGGISILFFLGCQAKTYCVRTASELHNALREASVNHKADVIYVLQGTYYGNFMYDSIESYGLTIEGGYLEGCSNRVVDRTKTILDGGGRGTVLVLSSPRAATKFVLEGLTIQGGEATDSNPGGLILKTRGGKVIFRNCAVNGGVSRGAGGVVVEDGVVKGGIRQQW